MSAPVIISLARAPRLAGAALLAAVALPYAALLVAVLHQWLDVWGVDHDSQLATLVIGCSLPVAFRVACRIAMWLASVPPPATVPTATLTSSRRRAP